jgi:HK97 family phage portal protein
MALLSGLHRESRAAVTASNQSLKDPATSDLFGGGINSASGQNVNSDSAMRTSAVYACVTIHAQTMAMLPKRVMELQPEGGRMQLFNHRYSKLIGDRPNRWQSDFEFYEYMAGCRWLRGNAYAFINFNPGRQENEWVPMDPSRVWPFVKTPTGTTYYMYDNSPPPPVGSKLFYQYFPLNAETIILDSSEVIHIRGFSRNGIVGMDPITRAAREAIGLSMATEEHGARLFSNGAQISKVFKHPGKLGDVTYDRMKQSLGGNFTGVSNANKTIILEEGMSIENLSMTMEAAQFLETRKFGVEEIARFYNMPLVLIGHGDKAPTYASAEQFFMSFKVHTVHPEVNRWQKAMQRALLYPSEVGRIVFDFDMDELIRGDAVARASYLQKRFQTSSITPDGIMVYEGENPSGTEAGKKLYIMSNMVPLEQAGQNVKPAPGAANE